jgi:prevent-host-death family protein
MHVVGSRELRPRLGEYLERAKDGDEVIVLVHGQPAALLRPVRPDAAGALVPSRFVRDELATSDGHWFESMGLESRPNGRTPQYVVVDQMLLHNMM